MAKFDPEHATVPDTNFSDRNSAERFLECGKFRRCANLKLEVVRLPRFYMPVCTESRFDRVGAAQVTDMPVHDAPLSPVTYMTIGLWAPLISCPRECKGYRDKRWAALTHALRRMFRGRQAKQTRTAQGNASDDGPITKAFSNGWVQNSGVASILALIAWLVAIWFHTGIKAAEITFTACAAFFVLVFLLAVAMNWDSRW